MYLFKCCGFPAVLNRYVTCRDLDVSVLVDRLFTLFDPVDRRRWRAAGFAVAERLQSKSNQYCSLADEC